MLPTIDSKAGPEVIMEGMSVEELVGSALRRVGPEPLLCIIELALYVELQVSQPQGHEQGRAPNCCAVSLVREIPFPPFMTLPPEASKKTGSSRVVSAGEQALYSAWAGKLGLDLEDSGKPSLRV